MKTQTEKMAERGELAAEVYTTLHNGTESFELGNVGCKLAYLMGAILKGSLYGAEVGDDEEFVSLLHTLFPIEHAVWSYIDDGAL